MGEKIPTKEEIAEAQALMRLDNKGLGETSDKIMRLYKDSGVHEVFMFYSRRMNEFGAYVFYLKNSDIRDSKQSGLSAKITDLIFAELESHGRGSRDEINLIVEFDSHENVEENFEGDYFLRLR